MRRTGFILFTLLVLLSCTHRNTNAPADIQPLQVTSFTGEKTTIESSSEYSYRQTLSWETNNLSDPVFAIRILTTDSILPEELTTDEEGWLYQNENSIWTDQMEFAHEFYSENGQLQHIISDIEIKYFAGNEESEIFPINFFKYREIGTRITSHGGEIDDEIIGTGTTFYLYENIEDIFVDGLYAEYFMYRLNIIEASTDEIITEGEWNSSLDLGNIRILNLNSYTTPALLPNNDGEQTQLEAYVVTRSGFEDVDNPAICNFTVHYGFCPNTIVYLPFSNMLGDHHYQTYFEDSLSDEVPMELVDGEIHYATPFWMDLEENYCLIGGNDVELNFRWGWHGEFQGDHPSLKYEGNVLDEETNINYLSFITFFDVRFDDEPLLLEEFPAIDENLITDNDGTTWLRIPKEYDFSQKISLTGLDYGLHVLEVRAVDSQMQEDVTPCVVEFEMHEPVPHEQREGILIVNDGYSPQWNPLGELELLYREYLSFYDEDIDVVVRNELENSGLHFSTDKLSPTDLQNYELVIYSMDYPVDDFNFEREFAVLNIYKDLRGNILLSSGKNLAKVYQNCINAGYTMLYDFFGIPLDVENPITFVSNSFLQNPFFIRADPQNGFTTTMDIRLPVLDWQPIFINSRAGLGPIALINAVSPEAEVIYTYGCKPPDSEAFPPTQEQYDELNGLPVAVKRDFGDHKCYAFGFPLAYMETAHAQEVLSQIVNEIQE